MSLSVGIVGLANAGKSTLFNALASRRLAETAPRPFTTIDPHEAVVSIEDEDLHRLCDLIKPDKCVPATVTFIDIAGLVKGAHKGEGLGNQFLAKIREVDAITHVVRAFEDPGVTHPHPSHTPGTNEQVIEDIELVNLELELGGVEKKPTIYVLNIDEDKFKSESVNQLIKLIEEKFGGEVISVAAKEEEEMVDLSDVDKKEMIELLNWEKSALNRLILEAYKLLNLVSFYTIKGGKEVHAWSLKKGEGAIKAAERVHTDFAQKFIKAEVISVEKLLELRDQLKEHTNIWNIARERGLIKLEGKDYVVEDKDIIEFKIGA
ncbi:hypothetical protein A2962_01990 [Candidatus Woesebacteria bacterium RIFCSPLOWO2_01_FULL_39_61]|uniref:OBG-type G domain-containing protein n=1 Tax=Candidatus Woesebacteria bacterium RIFCSPHIGHO2_02_FULL_39_13 TaxID=1802505 RepID=A0A1F7Z1D7_9BACT|nr:MAG: hypothetical protein A2692_02710 [Candidatus Woesebacteria bacterium RIFCSPHIGHO2_01_FULL_39_95]OGM33280.1 MAG: hypothetical protein A3D01_00630 [Candidatus Woesebacteria bacterium RIFCSPHIGHO2_02_FULL_39_13]OGM38452.1 MAG: hypothetical protein A3E13_00510 [Candidatus Woesebacteria bacterium RIFCSPHIGHO2_12_FULL_40_20]OGM66890.1 MAG: hypothetical protein A2962_01990 [Candidatus Woesebacteria bacterium RIFCSPLOWO2_01_FULL_39_61]OGM75329.1 MAG: hypothetical protein A3H19_02890 [Candidatus